MFEAAAITAEHKPRSMQSTRILSLPSDGEVHLWLLPIRKAPPSLLSEGYALLSAPERARNQRYYFEKDRVRHLFTRVFIRQLLGGYLDEDPAALQFEENAYGRPTLLRSDGRPPLDFNLSHAGDLIACGVVSRGRIGIDIEPVDRDVELGLASSFFAEKEIEELFSLPVERQREHFLRLWTLKEAYIKARGEGMAIALNSFAFWGFRNGTLQFWAQERAASSEEQWTALSLRPIRKHNMAIVWQHPAPGVLPPFIVLREHSLLFTGDTSALPCPVAYSGVWKNEIP